MRDWLKNAWLIEHQTSPREIADLLSVVDRDLDNCQTAGLSSDWKLNIAYNAALQMATAALAAAGYCAARNTHYYRVIQSLVYTIRADARLITQFHEFRKKRNISDYERAGVVSNQEVKEMVILARNLRASVIKWLRTNYPKLLQE